MIGVKAKATNSHTSVRIPKHSIAVSTCTHEIAIFGLDRQPENIPTGSMWPRGITLNLLQPLAIPRVPKNDVLVASTSWLRTTNNSTSVPTLTAPPLGLVSRITKPGSTSTDEADRPRQTRFGKPDQ